MVWQFQLMMAGTLTSILEIGLPKLHTQPIVNVLSDFGGRAKGISLRIKVNSFKHFKNKINRLC